MALFSNNMWQTEEMSPKKGVKNNPHTTTDSFVGAPLAVGSEEKFVIVTGSTSGIGFHTSKKLLAFIFLFFHFF